MKTQLKNGILEKRKNLSKAEVQNLSLQVIQNLKSLKEFKEGENILFYVSFDNEVDTHELIKEILKDKSKNILVPYTIRNKPAIFVSEIKDFVELEPRMFGILEPKEKYIREFNKEKLDLVIVPATVFGRDGFRIGYGHGYYDRFLKTIPNGVTKVGLGYDFQLIDKIPEEKHDVPMDIVITEKEVIEC